MQFISPLSSRYNKKDVLTSGYGARWGTFHAGEDYAVGRDLSKVEYVRAAFSGVVTYTFKKGIDRGGKLVPGTPANWVRINHNNGFETEYIHMAEDHVYVNIGDQVRTGQVIGRIGNTGYSTGPHLHFGIKYNGKYVDPAKYINWDLEHPSYFLDTRLA